MVLDLNINKDLNIFKSTNSGSSANVFQFENGYIKLLIVENGDTVVASTVSILSGQELVLIVDNLFQTLNLIELKIILNQGSKLTIVEQNNSELQENLIIDQAENSFFRYQKLYKSSGKSTLTINQNGKNCQTEIQNIVLGSNINLEINQKIEQNSEEQKLEHRTKFVLDKNSDVLITHSGRSSITSTNCIINQKIKGIILGLDSKVEMQPILEIDSDTSTSNHGASVGEFDRNEIFYLRSRGLSLAQTQKILVDSFLNDFYDEVEPICVRENWRG